MLEDRSDVYSLLLHRRWLLAIADWFCRSADTAFAESSGNVDIPRGISSIPAPLTVFLNLTIYLHVYTEVPTVNEGSLQVEVVTIDLSTMSNATVTANRILYAFDYNKSANPFGNLTSFLVSGTIFTSARSMQFAPTSFQSTCGTSYHLNHIRQSRISEGHPRNPSDERSKYLPGIRYVVPRCAPKQ